MKSSIKTQLSIVIPNKPGQIALVAKLLSDRQINVSGVMFVDTTTQGVVRFVIENASAAQKILEDAGYFVVCVQVVEVEFDNRIGALYEVANALGKAGVNIDYAYGSDNPNPSNTRVTFKLSDVERGFEALQKL